MHAALPVPKRIARNGGGGLKPSAKSEFVFADGSCAGPWQFYRHCDETSSLCTHCDIQFVYTLRQPLDTVP